MFNISEKTEIKNLEKTGCTKGHIQQCISDKNLHEKPIYEYFGKRVSRGVVRLHTKNGGFWLKFREQNGWATDVEIL